MDMAVTLRTVVTDIGVSPTGTTIELLAEVHFAVVEEAARFRPGVRKDKGSKLGSKGMENESCCALRFKWGGRFDSERIEQIQILESKPLRSQYTT